MRKVKVAVIGVGHLGSIHAQIYRQAPTSSLIGVCDVNKERLGEVSDSLGVPGFTDYRELFDKVEAVSIAVPASLHYKIASAFLKRGIHALIEKPFAASLKEADSLIRLARKQRLVLQVGHIERFNSAFSATQKLINDPKFIECHRLNPPTNRSLDVGAVLDIMIHDIDIILGLVASKIKKVEAIGINVLTRFEDIANARIMFNNGCVANLTASRVSDDTVRKIRIFQKDTYISLDYKQAEASVYRKQALGITKEDLPIEKEQPLQKELASFLECVIENKEPLVSGPVAREALRVALLIQQKIWRRRNTL